MCVKCGSGLRRGGVAGGTGDGRSISKTALCLLAFFLGGFGVHKFYTGNWAWGILYLIFFWTFVPALLALVEFIRYITLDELALQQAYQKVAGRPFGFLW